MKARSSWAGFQSGLLCDGDKRGSEAEGQRLQVLNLGYIIAVACASSHPLCAVQAVAEM